MKTNNEPPQGRYKPNPDWDGRKERDGFVCGIKTRPYFWCVAVKRDADSVSVRDTKDPTDTTLTFTKKEWSIFIDGVKNGEFDV